MPVFAAGLVCLLLIACSGVEMMPGERSHARREIPPGPGILTGEKGMFVLYRQGAEAETGDGEDQNAEPMP